MNNKRMNSQDHDLLIQINTKLERVISDVKELKDDTISRISHFEEEKEDKAEVTKMLGDIDKVHTDHEKRLRTVENVQDNFKGRYAIIAAIVIILLSAFVSWTVNIFSQPKSLQTTITTTPSPAINTLPTK